MASTVTLTGDWLKNIGNERLVHGTANLGVYATGGVAITPAQVGLGVINSFNPKPAGGYTFQYISSGNLVKAYSATPAGTLTQGAVTVVGAQAAGPGLQITPDSAAGVLGKTTAGTVTIPAATFGIAAPVFSGTAGALVEVANGVDITSTTFGFDAFGV